MKKPLIVLGICIFIIGMPAITAISAPKNIISNRSFSLFNKIITNEEDVPRWAEGEINGTWGLREFLLNKIVEVPIGNISGYYGKLFGPIYAFSGKIYPFWDSSKTTNISGLFFGPIVFGWIGDMNLTDESIYDIDVNETTYVGIGDQDESIFDWRIMGRTGPTFYLKGNFTEF
jgi:hypothetical protein